jgi:magnesium-transporting ATPase (P-type)
MPCDIVLSKCSDIKGVCYVETKSLDGETNLKIKSVHKDLNTKFSTMDHEDYKNNPGFKCTINSESPNNGIYKFSGPREIVLPSTSIVPSNL